MAMPEFLWNEKPIAGFCNLCNRSLEGCQCHLEKRQTGNNRQDKVWPYCMDCWRQHQARCPFPASDEACGKLLRAVFSDGAKL